MEATTSDYSSGKSAIMSTTMYQRLESYVLLVAANWPATVTLLLIGFIYLYFKRKFNYWTRLGLRSPTPIPWFGTTLHQLVTPKPELELQLHQNLGKLYGLYDGFLGTSPTLVCGHPEVIKQVTIKNFESFTNRRKPATWKSIRYRALTYMRDEEWKNLRKILAPTFTSNKLKKMFELMKRCTKNLQTSIEQHGNEEIDLKKIFSVFTVDVISTCCFSMDLKDYRHPNSEILISARKFFNVSKLKMAVYAAVPKTLLAFLGFDINDTDSIEFFGRFATEILNKRRKLAENPTRGTRDSSKRQDDFLQTMIDAAAEFQERRQLATSVLSVESQQLDEKPQPVTPINNSSSSSNNHNHNNNNTDDQEQQDVESASSDVAAQAADCVPNRDGEPGDASDSYHVGPPQYTEQQLGDLEILAQTMLFMAVGHETTATLLSSCGLFLALYPAMQERLYNEVHEAFLEDKGDLSYDTIMRLQYLDAFISEALRYYTPTLTFDREASEDVPIRVDGYDFVIPKGMGVVIPFHAIHHDPDNYEDPERFDPERFMPENRHKIKPCTFIPFGSGPRFCLASRFALMEAKLALANLVNKFQFVRSEGTIWPPKFRHHYMLMQMEWPRIKFVDRKLVAASRAQMAA